MKNNTLYVKFDFLKVTFVSRMPINNILKLI